MGSTRGITEAFTRAVAVAAARDKQLVGIEWTHGAVAEGQIAGIGKGAAKFVTINGPLTSPTVRWHHTYDEALTHDLTR